MGANTILKNKAIVFFDTGCLLCNRTVQILLNNDRQQLYYSGFTSLAAVAVLPAALREGPTTIVFYEKGRISVKSTAVFRIIRYLRFPWPLLLVFAILPTKLNDLVYDWVARNRIAWFGRTDSCILPNADQQARFFA